MWDPDGAGPAAPVVVLGGAFGVAGSAVARGIVTWDPATGVFAPLGNPIGAGSSDVVGALVVRSNNELFAAINSQTGSPTNRLVRWTGVSWVQVGPALDGPVRALAALPNGRIAVGGSFNLVSGVPMHGLASWNGAFTLLASGFSGDVRALTATAAGHLLVGGESLQINGASANCIARWNAGTWSTFGTGVASTGTPRVQAIAELANGDVVAGGLFTTAGGVPCSNIARWNGSSWSSLLGGVSTNPTGTGSVNTLRVLSNGDLVAGGVFATANGLLVRSVARWNGLAWGPLGPGFLPLSLTENSAVNDLVPLPGGDLVACGNFRSGGGQLGDRVSRWDGTAWRALAIGFNDTVACIAAGSGQLVAGGSFTLAGGAIVNRIARWNGAQWLPMGSGMNGAVKAVAVAPNGDVIAGGDFTVAGGVAANRIARWNGSQWLPFGSGMSASVNALAFDFYDGLIAAGDFTDAGGMSCLHIARWTGSAWLPVSTGLSGPVTALAREPYGIIAIGDFAVQSGFNVARWGNGWYYAGSLFAPRALAVTPAGQTYAASGNEVLRSSSTWEPLGAPADGIVSGLAALPNGDIVATGDFTTIGGVQAARIARWNGSTWLPIGSGLDGPGLALAWSPWGELAVGGAFTAANGGASAHVARLGTTCGATSAPFGGCPGAAGTNTLAVPELPWIGGVMRTHSYGLVPGALVIPVTGVTQVFLPLSSLTPIGVPGCNLVASPDMIGGLLQAHLILGVTEGSLAIPNNAALVGQSFLHQQVVIEPVGPVGMGAITVTNAQALTIGAF